MTLRILFHPLADGDIEAIYDFIAEDSLGRAIAFVRRLRKFCFGLADMPMRGRSRDELAPGVRTITFEKRLVYAGRDMEKVHWP